jgi:Tfp pilus assembly protein PilE
MHKQRGITFIGLVFVVAAIVFVAVIGMKLTPAYLEYMSVKKVIAKIAREPSFAEMSKKDIVDEFDKGATIDSIKVIQGSDLEITKGDAGKQIVTAQYQVVVPLVANVSALLDFKASTDSNAP